LDFNFYYGQDAYLCQEAGCKSLQSARGPCANSRDGCGK
jgi:hypothetical protein